MKENKYDPVYQDKDGLWYHWNETWSGKFGPFETEEIAKEHLDDYCNYLNGCGYN